MSKSTVQKQNKISFVNQTVEVRSTLTFSQMQVLEQTLKSHYLEVATGGDVNAAEVLKELGESLGVDAEETLEHVEDLYEVAG